MMDLSVQESGAFESTKEMKRKCLAIKDFIKDGEIDKAKELIRELCPELLEVTLFACHSFSRITLRRTAGCNFC